MNTQSEIKKEFISVFKDLVFFSQQENAQNLIFDYLINKAEKNNNQIKIEKNLLRITLLPKENTMGLKPIGFYSHINLKPDLTFKANPEPETNNYSFDPIDDFLFTRNTGNRLDLISIISLTFISLLLKNDFETHPKMIFCITVSNEEAFEPKNLNNFQFLEETRLVIDFTSKMFDEIIFKTAGKERIDISYDLEMNQTIGTLWELDVSNLTGGHIGKVPESTNMNAAKIIAQILGHLQLTHQIRLVSLDCRTMENRILDQGKAVFLAQCDNKTLCDETVRITDLISGSFAKTDPEIKINLGIISPSIRKEAFTPGATSRMIFNLLFFPDGPQIRKNGITYGTINLTGVKADNNIFTIKCDYLFDSENENKFLKNIIMQYGSISNGFINNKEFYPIVNINADNDIIYSLSSDFIKATGKEPKFVSSFESVNATEILPQLPGTRILMIGLNIRDYDKINESIDLNSLFPIYKFLKLIILSQNY